VILGPDVRVSSEGPGVLDVDGLTAEQIGNAAARNGFVLHELTPEKTSLEEAFMELTREETEYRAVTPINENVAGTDRQERVAA
jgi:ABC-2 type transport system ATP-binding protein